MRRDEEGVGLGPFYVSGHASLSTHICVNHSFPLILISEDILLLIQLDPSASLMIYFVSYRVQAFDGHRAIAGAFFIAASSDLQEVISGPENGDQTVMLIERIFFSNFFCCKVLEYPQLSP